MRAHLPAQRRGKLNPPARQAEGGRQEGQGRAIEGLEVVPGVDELGDGEVGQPQLAGVPGLLEGPEAQVALAQEPYHAILRGVSGGVTRAVGHPLAMRA